MRAKQPVVVGLSGGLGNQMFQYAAGQALAQRLDTSLLLDTSWFRGRSDREYALAPFRITASENAGPVWWPDAAVNGWCRVTRRWAISRLGVVIFREPHFHFVPAFDRISQPVYLEGYWQSQRYFAAIRETLLVELVPAATLPAACQHILTQIKSSDAICVHVRRGDYVSNPLAAKTHGLCSLDYYAQALKILPKNESSHCFVFSDDPLWVQENLHLDCKTTVVDVNDEKNAHWDLHLMSACRYFIIANSSLSWWAAWLGTTVGKRVIAPLRWFKANNKDTSDLIPSDWLRL